MVVPPASTHKDAHQGYLWPSLCAQATQMMSAERQQDHTLPALLLFVYVHRFSTNIKKYIPIRDAKKTPSFLTAEKSLINLIWSVHCSEI